MNRSLVGVSFGAVSLLSAAIVFGAESAGPSFNCAAAQTATEKLICSDPGLSALDLRMARLFAAERADPAKASAVLADQRKWIADDRNKCADTDCLRAAYQSRITALTPATPAEEKTVVAPRPPTAVDRAEAPRIPPSPPTATAQIQQPAVEPSQARRFEPNAPAEAQQPKAEEMPAIDLAGVREKGLEFAKTSGTTWELKQKKNELTDEVDITVTSVQKNDSGAVAQVTGICEKQSKSARGLVFTALLVDDDGNPTLGFPDQKNGKAVSALVRLNEDKAQERLLVAVDFNNSFPAAIMFSQENAKIFAQEALGSQRGQAALFALQARGIYLDSIEATWRVLVQIKTSRDPVLVRIPMFDRNIQKLVDSCR